MTTNSQLSHHESCDVNDINPDGIKKPCNCGGLSEYNAGWCDGILAAEDIFDKWYRDNCITAGATNAMELAQRLFKEADLPPANPTSELSSLNGSDDAELRRMLAWAYSGHHLYCGDGELQDSREAPFIDFKRDSVAMLRNKMEERALNKLHRELHQLNGGKVG